MKLQKSIYGCTGCGDVKEITLYMANNNHSTSTVIYALPGNGYVYKLFSNRESGFSLQRLYSSPYSLRRVLHGSVVECLTRNPGVLGSSRTGSSGFFVGVSLSNTLQSPSLVLMKPRKNKE